MRSCHCDARIRRWLQHFEYISVPLLLDTLLKRAIGLPRQRYQEDRLSTRQVACSDTERLFQHCFRVVTALSAIPTESPVSHKISPDMSASDLQCWHGGWRVLLVRDCAAATVQCCPMHFQIAQLNVGRLLHPLDHPQIAEFVNGLDEINALAESATGFVWRFQTESGNATDAQHPWSADPFMLVNMSVWKTPEDLKNFTYRSGHLEYYLKRAEWFERLPQAHYVLWWVPVGHIPTLNEAQERLEHYRQNGATPYAFWFGKLFPAESNVLLTGFSITTLMSTTAAGSPSMKSLRSIRHCWSAAFYTHRAF